MANVNREQLGELPREVASLHVTALLFEGIVGGQSGDFTPMLDGILAAVYARRERLLPPSDPSECAAIDIPIQKSACGRVYLCSSGVCHALERQNPPPHKHRRAPCVEYARLGSSKITSVLQTGGADKSYRVPYEYTLLQDNCVEWWCLGDQAMIESLLREVSSLGKFRGAGKGRVREWVVEQCEPWGDGFPVLRDGQAMRPLPLDYPGLAPKQSVAYRTLCPPYHLRMLEEPCVVPRSI
ncbi:MAG: hypothetical protein ABFD89_17840 [Bryobacteraceae bacterium]